MTCVFVFSSIVIFSFLFSTSPFLLLAAFIFRFSPLSNRLAALLSLVILNIHPNGVLTALFG